MTVALHSVTTIIINIHDLMLNGITAIGAECTLYHLMSLYSVCIACATQFLTVILIFCLAFLVTLCHTLIQCHAVLIIG